MTFAVRNSNIYGTSMTHTWRWSVLPLSERHKSNPKVTLWWLTLVSTRAFTCAFSMALIWQARKQSCSLRSAEIALINIHWVFWKNTKKQVFEPLSMFWQTLSRCLMHSARSTARTSALSCASTNCLRILKMSWGRNIHLNKQELLCANATGSWLTMNLIGKKQPDSLIVKKGKKRTLISQLSSISFIYHSAATKKWSCRSYTNRGNFMN